MSALAQDRPVTARGIRVAPILINPYLTAREGRLLVAHDPSPCYRGRLMIDRSYLRKATNVGSRLGSAYDGEGDSGCTCYH